MIYSAHKVYKFCRAERPLSPVVGTEAKAQTTPTVDAMGKKHPMLSVAAMNEVEQSFSSEWGSWYCAGYGNAVSAGKIQGIFYTTAHMRLPAVRIKSCPQSPGSVLIRSACEFL